jgi:broad specificity phosphatase PhoE
MANFTDGMMHGVGSFGVPMVLGGVLGEAGELGSFAMQSQYETYTSLRKAGVDKDAAETAGLVNAMLTAATMKAAFLPSRIVREQVDKLSLQEVLDAVAGKGNLKDAIYNVALKLAPTSGDARNAFLATIQQGAMDIANYEEQKELGLPQQKQDNQFTNMIQTAGTVFLFGALGRVGDKAGAAMMAKRYADDNPMMFATAMSNAKTEAMATGRYNLNRLNELENSVYGYYQKAYNTPGNLTSDQKLAVSHIVDNMNYFRNQMNVAGENFKPYWDKKLREIQGQLDDIMTDPNAAITYNNKITEPIVEHLRNLIPEDERTITDNRFNGVIARHAQTNMNAQGKFNNDDTPLNDEGKKQAKDLGTQLQAQGVTHIITSPSVRSVETAEATGLPHVTSAMLNEWNTGIGGGSVSSFDMKYYVDHPDEKPEGGESFNDFLGRVQALRRRASELDGETGLVTHGLTMKLWEALDKSGGKWDEVAKTEFLKDSNDFDNAEMYSPASGRVEIKGDEDIKPSSPDKPIQPKPDKTVKEPTRQEKVNDLMDRTDKFNKLAKNAKNKASELNEIRLAAKELGVKVDYSKDHAILRTEKGNKVQRRSTTTNKSVIDFDPESYSEGTKSIVNKLTDSPDLIHGLDIPGADGKNMTAQQRETALNDIKEGKKTVGAKAMYDALAAMDKDGMVHWKNPETGERMSIPFEDYFSEPIKEATDDEIEELNALLGEDAFNETFDNIIYDYENEGSDQPDKESAEGAAGEGKKEPVGDIKDSKGSEVTPEQKAVAEQLQAAREELATATDAFKQKRKELDKDLQDDQEDLFGERKSQQESKLFDERADPEARDKALKPFKDRMEKAKAEVERLEAKQKEYADKGTSQRNLLDAIDEEKNMASEKEQPYFEKRKAVAEKYGKDIDQIIKELKDDDRLKVDCPPGAKRRLSLKNLISRKK